MIEIDCPLTFGTGYGNVTVLHLQDVKKMRTNWKIMNEGGFDLNLKRYKRYLEEKGYRESTVEGYLSYIARYLNFVGTDKPSSSITDSVRTLLVSIVIISIRMISLVEWKMDQMAGVWYKKMAKNIGMMAAIPTSKAESANDFLLDSGIRCIEHAFGCLSTPPAF